MTRLAHNVIHGRHPKRRRTTPGSCVGVCVCVCVCVVHAGIVQFTPLSVVHELQALLGKATAGTATDAATAAGAPDAAAQAAWLRDHVFSSRETWRRAERLLFNKQCVVLPNLT